MVADARTRLGVSSRQLEHDRKALDAYMIHMSIDFIV